MIGNGLMCNSYKVGDSVLKSFASFAEKVKLSEDELTWKTEKGKFYSVIDLFIVHHWIMQDYRFSSRANNSQPVRFTSSRSIPFLPICSSSISQSWNFPLFPVRNILTRRLAQNFRLDPDNFVASWTGLAPDRAGNQPDTKNTEIRYLDTLGMKRTYNKTKASSEGTVRTFAI